MAFLRGAKIKGSEIGMRGAKIKGTKIKGSENSRQAKFEGNKVVTFPVTRPTQNKIAQFNDPKLLFHSAKPKYSFDEKLQELSIN